MDTCIAMLRGINVSGQKKINMNDLKVLLEGLGLQQVSTYIQSGNVVFKYVPEEPATLARLIQTGIAEKYGFEVPVVIRTAAEIAETLSGSPYTDVDKLHVTFLSEAPAPALVDKIAALDFKPDAFTLAGREIYVYCPDGYGRTKITNTFFEAKLKITATTRNWRTVQELHRMAMQQV
jgi:uncharacterized protein (DUF1697 family)